MSCRSNTSFTSDDIHGSSDANRAFGEDESLLVARPGKNCCSSFWFTIPDGFYAIVTNHGVQVDYEDTDGTKSCVWPPGLHLGVSSISCNRIISLFLYELKLSTLKLIVFFIAFDSLFIQATMA
jgi:hypothetical protein